MPILSFCPFSFAFAVPVAVLATRLPSSVSGLSFLAFFGLYSLFVGLFNLDILCCLFIWGFTFFGPLLTLIFGIFACTRFTHLIRCFRCMWSMLLFWPFLSYIFLLLYLLYHFALVFFWPFLALVFWPLSLYTALQLYWHYFYHLLACHLRLFCLYQYLHHLVPFVFMF